MIPTAEELLKQHGFEWSYAEKPLHNVMIEFAKLHVKEALNQAAENAKAKEDPDDYGTGDIWVDRNSILNAYPESNIK